MADDPRFYRDRAAEEQRNADVATLDNVRDRCQRAAGAWTAMADRAERTRTMRLAREATAGGGVIAVGELDG